MSTRAKSYIAACSISLAMWIVIILVAKAVLADPQSKRVAPRAAIYGENGFQAADGRVLGDGTV